MVYEYIAEVTRIVDGDTIDLRLDLGFRMSHYTRARLYAVDTPESRTRNLREKKFGKLATARMNELCPVGSKQSIISYKLDKYGRPLIDIRLPRRIKHQSTVNKLLVHERLAVQYRGQNKADVRTAHEANWDYLESRGLYRKVS